MSHRRVCLALIGGAMLAGASETRAQAATQTPSPIPISFFGEVRTRSEWDRPGGAVSADAFTFLRSRFGARIDPAPGARIVVQVQDSRVLGAEGNTSAAAPDVFDLHQGYVELSSPVRRTAVTVRAGRQEIAFGNERLVGAVNWSNTGRSFDGVRLNFAPVGAKAGTEPWAATVFAATMEERGRRFGTTTATVPPGKTPDHTVAGAFVRRMLGATALETTALYDGGARYRAYDDANRVTLDGRWHAPHAFGVSVDVEGAYQFGSQRIAPVAPALARDQRVSAWLVGARLGTPEETGRRASVSLGADALSGDATPADGRYGAFGTMFGTNHPFYGLMDLFLDPASRTRERGLVDVFATASLVLGPRAGVRSEVHHFALSTGGEKQLGWEGDLVLPVRLNSAAGVDLGYTLFRAASGAEAVGLGASGSSRHWAYLQLRVGF